MNQSTDSILNVGSDPMASSYNPDPLSVNVAGYLRKMARTQPYQRAVVSPCGRDANGRVAYTHLTFRQLDVESDRLAKGLGEAGIGRGVRTILMVRPSLDFFALVFGLFKAGAVPVVVDPGMGVRRMLACLRESRAQALIGIAPAHVLRTLAPTYFSGVKTAITVGRRLFWGGRTLEQVRAERRRPYRIADTRSDELAAILFTTGSTGPAKGVRYSHGVFDAQVRNIRDQFGIAPGEIDLPTFPLFALFDPALGMTAIIPDMDPTKPARVNPHKIVEAIVDQGVTNMFASPALLDRVGRYGRQRGLKLPTLKRVITAGAPAAPAMIEQFAAMLTGQAQVHTGYGATEAMPVSAFGSDAILGETRRRSEKGYGMCVGPPLSGVDVRIIAIDDGPLEQWTDALELPQGEIGEIIVRGDQVTPGYFERPDADALSKIADGDTFWHRMGDLGWLDKKGRIWFCGRKSHRVVTAQATFYTVPCEAIFNNHPRVFRSALVGVGPQGSQRPVVCIELVPGDRGNDQDRLESELLALAKESPITSAIETILFHRAFPVDVRHNSKIFREQLAVWAAKRL
jgi:acyl-CoA synthetase (AMP-forming)/AMP-acid ligase II